MGTHNKSLVILLGLAFLIVGYNNCSQSYVGRFSKNTSISGTNGAIVTESGGDGYTGKVSFYNHYQPEAPCRERDTNNNPLPNSQLMLSTSGLQKVRVLCSDISPITLAPTEYRIVDNLTIETQGAVYSHVQSKSFDTMVATCPAGYTPLVNPSRVNIIGESGLDLTDGNKWEQNRVAASQLGSFAGMPSYLLTRITDARTEQWHRLGLYENIGANEYTVSFFARSSSANSIRMEASNLTNMVSSTWNLETGQLIDIGALRGMTNIATSSVPIAGGYFITHSFRTDESVGGIQIGIGPGDFTIGSTVEATGVQFETIESYCGR